MLVTTPSLILRLANFHTRLGFETTRPASPACMPTPCPAAAATARARS